MFTDKGGALTMMAKPFQFYVGSQLGSGKQWVPWIQLEDLCEIYIKAVKDKTMHGTYNASSSDQPTNKELTKAISKAVRKPVFLPPAPGFVLKLALGDMANALLEGSRVSNEKIKKAGFVFKHEELEKSLSELL